MTEPLPETPHGSIALGSAIWTCRGREGKTVIAMGPGLGRRPRNVAAGAARAGSRSRSPWCWTPTRSDALPGSRHAADACACSRRIPAKWRA